LHLLIPYISASYNIIIFAQNYLTNNCIVSIILTIINNDYRDHAIHYSKAHFGEGTGYVWMDEVQCTGTENDLSQCTFPGFGQVDCDHTEDAGVACQQGKFDRL